MLLRSQLKIRLQLVSWHLAEQTDLEMITEPLGQRHCELLCLLRFGIDGLHLVDEAVSDHFVELVICLH